MRNEGERVGLCEPQDLARMAREGDIEALERMTRCFGERLQRVGRRYCRDAEQAEDAVQDALLSAGTHLRDFRGEGSLEGWLVRMVANACHHMRRGRKNDPALHATEIDLSTPADTPEDLAVRGELTESLGDALQKLEPRDRAILILAEAEDWTGPQIAEELGMTAGAVRTRLSRARTRMRKLLEKQLAHRQPRNTPAP